MRILFFSPALVALQAFDFLDALELVDFFAPFHPLAVLEYFDALAYLGLGGNRTESALKSWVLPFRRRRKGMKRQQTLANERPLREGSVAAFVRLEQSEVSAAQLKVGCSSGFRDNCAIVSHQGQMRSEFPVNILESKG